jgi:hypothetical protein
LKKMADDPNNPLAAKAAQTWNAIGINYSSALQLGYPIPWRTGIDPSKLTLLDLEQAYFGADEQYVRLALLQYFWGRADFPIADRLDFLIRIIETDGSMKSKRCFDPTFRVRG